MKGKRQLSYEKLKTEVIDAVRKHFVPSVDLIKKRIESLLEQEYIERDADHRNLYRYKA